jgi:Kef-type K+ transport system membrane component KefB
METVNIILLVSGAIVLLFGIGAFLNPNLARWINAPGSPRLKSIIALIIGIILVIVSFIYEIPTN